MEDELIYQEALKYYLGVFRDKNVLHALSLMRMVAQKGNLKAINLIARWYIVDIQNYDFGVEWLRKGKEMHDGQSTCRLAICYRKGWGVEKNIDEAVNLFKLAFDYGYAGSCFYLSELYKKGKEVPLDKVESKRWLERGAECGDECCIVNLARCYYKGEGVEKNICKARELLERVGEYNVTAQENLGIMYYKGALGIQVDIEKSIKWLEKAKVNGSVKAIRILAKIKENEGNRDDEIRLLEEAANKGDAISCYKLGFLLLSVCRNNNVGKCEESFKWINKAATKKVASAEFLLGLFYKVGLGTPIDLEKSFYWYKVAARHGYEQAYSHIGRFYRDGNFVVRNYKTALMWFNKALNSENQNVKGEALYDYGKMFLNGWGVQKNIMKAQEYLYQSKMLGCKNGENEVEKLLKQTDSKAEKTGLYRKGTIFDFIRSSNKEKIGTWVKDADRKLECYLNFAVDEKFVQILDGGSCQWISKSRYFAQWVVCVSEDLKLYVKEPRKGVIKGYYGKFFANTFIDKKGKAFKEADVRHNIWEFNSGNVPENENINNAVEKAKKYIEKNFRE